MAQAVKNVDAAGRRIAKKGEPKLARYLEKEVTPVIEDFADFLEKQTGMTLNKRDRQVLFIGSALRGTFQKSPENQARIAQRKEEIAAELEDRQARHDARVAKKAARAEKASEPKTAKGAPAKSTKTAHPTKSAPAKAGTTRRRPAAKSSNSDF